MTEQDHQKQLEVAWARARRVTLLGAVSPKTEALFRDTFYCGALSVLNLIIEWEKSGDGDSFAAKLACLYEEVEAWTHELQGEEDLA